MSYVYVMVNEGLPDLVKIGWSNNPQQRLSELSGSTSSPLPFSLEYSVYAGDRAYAVEQLAHHVLESHRVNDRREFFRVTPETALRVIYQSLIDDEEENKLSDLREKSLEEARSYLSSQNPVDPGLTEIIDAVGLEEFRDALAKGGEEEYFKHMGWSEVGKSRATRYLPLVKQMIAEAEQRGEFETDSDDDSIGIGLTIALWVVAALWIVLIVAWGINWFSD